LAGLAFGVSFGRPSNAGILVAAQKKFFAASSG
jgi:hypothetical protein